MGQDTNNSEDTTRYPWPTARVGREDRTIRVDWIPDITHWKISTRDLEDFSIQAQELLIKLDHEQLDFWDFSDVENELNCLSAYYTGRGLLSLSESPLLPYNQPVDPELEEMLKLSSLVARRLV